MTGVADLVLILTVPTTLGQIPTLWPYGYGLTRRIAQANNSIVETSERWGAVAVTTPPIEGKVCVWADGVHPTSFGHLEMASAAVHTLQIRGCGATTIPRVDMPVLETQYLRWR